MAFSRSDVSKLGSALIKARKATAMARHKAGEGMHQIVRTGIVGVAAGAMGYWAGHKAKNPGTDTLGPNFFGVPADLGLGIALKAAALMGVGGRENSEYMNAAADGCFGAYFSTMGYEYGKGLSPTDSKWAPRALLGEDKRHPALSVEALTAADLAKLAL